MTSFKRVSMALAALAPLLLASNEASAYDCASVRDYSDDGRYATGNVVERGGNAYRCTVGGWCTVGGPYAPGDGWAWTNAWDELGACNGSSGSGGGGGGTPPGGGSGGGSGSPRGSCPAWSTNGNYDAGAVVEYNGAYYVAEHANPGYDPTISTWYWEPTPSCPGGDGGNGGGGAGEPPPPPPPAGRGFAAVVSEAQFEQMFPGRNGFYTYRGLVEAAATFPAFATTGNDTTRRREAAAALANFSHETGGLVYIEEIARGEYCSGTATPCGVCAPGKRYYGRGPTQLSWNYNYCTAGRALGLDLWNNPEQVATNPTTAWRTALWFWMTQTGAGNRTSHDAMTGGGGFGETIRTINGALECNGGNPAQVRSRIAIYQNFAQILGTSPGDRLGC